MLEAVNSVWFATRIRLLSKRTTNILTSVVQVKNKDEVERVERELNTCSAMLEQLLDYAKHNKVMSSEDYEIAQKTHTDLSECQRILAERKLSWWQKALAKISALLPFMIELLEFIAACLYPRNPTAGLLVAGISRVIGFLPAAKI